MSKQSEQQFFDAEFGEGVRTSVHGFYALDGSFKTLISYLQAHTRDKQVLEYGCGTGSSIFYIADQISYGAGIDISTVGIRGALDRSQKSGLTNLSFMVMDAESLGFSDSSFDVVCAVSILHHLDLATALTEISRVVRKEGHIVFYEPLGHNPFINLYRFLTPKLRTADEHPLIVRDLEQIQHVFPEVEFQFFYMLTLFALPFRKSAFFSSLVDKLNTIDQFFFRSLPFLRRFAWHVIGTIDHSNSSGDTCVR
jgi:SAM-dependent methyltransferase